MWGLSASMVSFSIIEEDEDEAVSCSEALLGLVLDLDTRGKLKLGGGQNVEEYEEGTMVEGETVGVAVSIAGGLSLAAGSDSSFCSFVFQP